jgi:uncharacterized Rossmann fold enzyme
MRFEDWEPFYEAILEDFGYSRDEDVRAARALEDRVGGFDTGRLDSLLRDKTVGVVGDAPSLDARRVGADAVVAADGAAKRLDDAGVEADVIVTDLDGAPRHAAEASHDGTVAVVHAHGDNKKAVESRLPEFRARNVAGTTQARSFGDIYNFGGFTDGDRAAYLADEFGASRIELHGFDFAAAEGEKRKKLRWAKRLLRALSEERGGAFL